MHHQELQMLQQNKSTHKISFLFISSFLLQKTWLCEDTNMKYFILLVSCG